MLSRPRLTAEENRFRVRALPVRWSRRERREEALLGWLFVVPAAALVFGVLYYPLAHGIEMSFRSLDLTSGLPERFIGLRNYQDVLTDPDTRSAAAHTAAYIAVAVTIELAVGLAMALTLRRPFRYRTALLAVVLLPWAMPAVVRAALWKRVFAAEQGLLNSLLIHLHVTHGYHVWLGDPVLSKFVIGIVHA